jgi:hypothetical protein
MNIELKIGEILTLPTTGKYVLCCTDPAIDHLLDSQIITILKSKEIYLYCQAPFTYSI